MSTSKIADRHPSSKPQLSTIEAAGLCELPSQGQPTRQWPFARPFAFTIFDDTDWATLEKIQPVYDLLRHLGMLTTKSVWLFKGAGRPINGGATCEDPAYVRWLLELQREGFEIALHNSAPVTSSRGVTNEALNRFTELFGSQMLVHCNHAGCAENIYWGPERFTGWRRLAYNALTYGQNRNQFRGHVESDPLFWGDLCRERIRYVRNFVFDEVNTLAVCPEMPYHDPTKPYVNFWFASTEGGSVTRFLQNFTIQAIDRLAHEGGLSIAYVHFARDFARNGRVNPEFRKRLEYIASKGGWFVPVSEVLDYLRAGGGRETRAISPVRRRDLELRWLISRVAGRGSAALSGG